jgi:hypothetical protein
MKELEKHLCTQSDSSRTGTHQADEREAETKAAFINLAQIML